MMGRYIDFRDERNDKPQLRPGVRETEEICRSNVLEIEVRPLSDNSGSKANRDDLRAEPASLSVEAFRETVAADRVFPFVATLEIENAKIEYGGQIDFTVLLLNRTNSSASLMNSKHSFPPPRETTKLLIFKSNGRVIGDLLGHRKMTGGGSFTSLTNWIVVPPGGIIGIRDRVGASVSSLADDVSPGDYRIQMSFLDRFVSDYPYAGLPEPDTVPDRENDPRYVQRMQQWRVAHPGAELFRSNAVEIKVGIGD